MPQDMPQNVHQQIEPLVEHWPLLRRPVLVTGFQGWNDAGEGATAGVRWLVRHLDGERIARVRPDPFHVFTEMESRPVVRSRGEERVLRWPAHDLFAIRDDRWSNDLVVLVAREPELRWRTYCEAILAVAHRLEVQHVVTLGAFLAPVPHTRPVPLTAYSWGEDAELRLKRVGAQSASYEGPTGIVSVFADAAHTAGLSATGLWAAVPHYLPTVANPKAALALLRALRSLTDLSIDLAKLEDAAAFFDSQVNDAVAAKTEVAEHVRDLEGAAESESGGLSSGPASELPAAADVIAAFEDMLRRGSKGDGGG